MDRRSERPVPHICRIRMLRPAPRRGAFTLHIRPTDQLKELTALDLPIALALLGHAGVVPAEALPHLFSAGEMGLDGHLQPPASKRDEPPRSTPAPLSVDALLLPDGWSQILASWGPPGKALRTNHLEQAVALSLIHI